MPAMNKDNKVTGKAKGKKDVKGSKGAKNTIKSGKGSVQAKATGALQAQLMHTNRKKSNNSKKDARASFAKALSGDLGESNQNKKKKVGGLRFADDDDVMEVSEVKNSNAGGNGGRKGFQRSTTMSVPEELEVMKSLDQYSIDDLRRVVLKQIELKVLDINTIDMYLEGEPNQTEEKVLCMMDESIKWQNYKIRNQDFIFPHFMTNPVYLAAGGFGTVVKCFRYGVPVAVKKVSVPDEHDWEMALRLLRELVILKQAKKVKQRHVAKIIDIFGDKKVTKPEDMDHIYITMPLYSPGSIENMVVDTLDMFRTISGHTLNALHFLHEHKIMHRDIKKENIFYHAATNKAYLADLGQARTLQNNMSGNGEVGTRCYLSPEIMLGKEYGFTSDVYSLGQSWYEMMCLSDNKTLFPYGKSGGKVHLEMQSTMTQYMEKKRANEISQDDIDNMPFAHSRWELAFDKAAEWKEENIVHVIDSTMQFDPKKRADTHALFNNPFFHEFKTEVIKVDLRMVESDDYDEIKQRIFDLQHGSCKGHAKHAAGGNKRAPVRKMCSMAVEYFDKKN